MGAQGTKFLQYVSLSKVHYQEGIENILLMFKVRRVVFNLKHTVHLEMKFYFIDVLFLVGLRGLLLLLLFIHNAQQQNCISES